MNLKTLTNVGKMMRTIIIAILLAVPLNGWAEEINKVKMHTGSFGYVSDAGDLHYRCMMRGYDKNNLYCFEEQSEQTIESRLCECSKDDFCICEDRKTNNLYLLVG